MTAPLHPRGTLRARFEPSATRPRDVFRRLGVGARSCDLGDQGLYLAEELVAADVGWLGSGEQPEALAILVLALMIAQRQGSTRLPLDTRGPLRPLVAEIGRLAGLELDAPRVLRTIVNLTSAPRFNSVIGARDARLPLVVEDGCLYTERSRWLEHRVATRLAERLRPAPPSAPPDEPPTVERVLAATLATAATPPTPSSASPEPPTATSRSRKRASVIREAPASLEQVLAASLDASRAREAPASGSSLEDVLAASLDASRAREAPAGEPSAERAAAGGSSAKLANSDASRAHEAPASKPPAHSNAKLAGSDASRAHEAPAGEPPAGGSNAKLAGSDASRAHEAPAGEPSAERAAAGDSSAKLAGSDASRAREAPAGESSAEVTAGVDTLRAREAPAGEPSAERAAAGDSSAKLAGSDASRARGAPAGESSAEVTAGVDTLRAREAPAGKASAKRATSSSRESRTGLSSLEQVLAASHDAHEATAGESRAELGAGLDAATSTPDAASATTSRGPDPASAPASRGGPRPSSSLEAFLDELRVTGPAMRALTEEQIGAVRVALTGRIAVVTGGPGTGKTVVAAAIVRGLARLGIGDIALAAQTGKAANRLTEVIGQQLAAIGRTAAPHEADRALAAAPPLAQTLHRLLGYRGGRFAHHAQSPLPVGAVLVDEASMIDLELIDALLDALPPSAPLILIGDAHQLPAIDAGQVLADLAEPDSVATARVATLRHSFRMDMDDLHGRAVYQAARAVHDGEIQRLFDRRNPLAVPRTAGALAFRGVEWVDTATARPQETTLAVATTLWHHVEGPRILRLAERVFAFEDGRVAAEQHGELEALWQLLGRARILTATRALPTGSLAINEHLHELALERMSVAGRPDFVPGEPVMITANDYQRGLFNGDQGIVVRADEGLGRHHYRALFRCGGELRPFAIEALRDRLELSWALTVHKSQGSELDAVAIVVPHEDLPLLTRELLYTAITRARTGVAIAGSRQILAAAGKRRALRYSGLGPRLRAALAQ